MSINNVLLFISSTSQACVPAVKFIRENGLPVMLMRLDTVEDRQRAANGPFFKIINVPTLVISYTDNNVQIYSGSEKILEWLTSITKKKVEEKPQSSSKIEELEIEVEEKKPKKKKKKKVVTFEEEDDEEIELLEKPSKGSSKKQSKKQPKVNANVSVDKNIDARNSSVFNMAKKMEQERKSFLSNEDNE